MLPPTGVKVPIGVPLMRGNELSQAHSGLSIQKLFMDGSCQFLWVEQVNALSVGGGRVWQDDEVRVVRLVDPTCEVTEPNLLRFELRSERFAHINLTRPD